MTRPRTISPVSAAEVIPGLVAHIDAMLPASTPEVQLSWNRVGEKVRPFVCLAVGGPWCVRLSWWTPLSSRSVNDGGFRRLRILPAWKRGGGMGFHQINSYLHDSRDIAVIPTRLLPTLTSKELAYPTRSHLTPDGLADVLREIESSRPLRRIQVPEMPVPPATITEATR